MNLNPETPHGDATSAADLRSEEQAASLESKELATILEIDGTAVWLGEVPTGLELIDFDLIPGVGRERLGEILSTVGNIGTISGNIAEAVTKAQGLYRLSDATRSLIQGGAQLTVKDGANLGSVMLNGKVIAQARFIPVTLQAATVVTSIMPAVALLGLQLALGETTNLAKTNIALTKQTLEAIRKEQWSKLKALDDTVASTTKKARKVGTVTETLWDSIAGKETEIDPLFDNYQRAVTNHLSHLSKANIHDKRQYLEHHAEAITFDSYALLRSLRIYAEYSALKAGIAFTRSESDPNEKRVVDQIAKEASQVIEEQLGKIRTLILDLVRVLRINSELPGKASQPLTKKHRDEKAVKHTCGQLLKAISPLADLLQPPVEMPKPETVCAPDGLDHETYLKVLRWHLETDEELRGIAFACEGTCGANPPIAPKRVDDSWNTLTASGLGGKTLALAARSLPGQALESTLVAVTNRRIITADPEKLLKEGELRDWHPLETVKYVRPTDARLSQERPTIGITTERVHYEWVFPKEADATRL